MILRPMRVISGGQAGADVAGLRAAVACGIETGGWIPRGYRTEDGPRPMYAKQYGLKEHVSREYGPRTLLNLAEADVTFLFGVVTSPGSALTLRQIVATNKPWWVNPDLEAIQSLALRHAPDRTLTINIAGNRESANPGIYAYVFTLLCRAWEDPAAPIRSAASRYQAWTPKLSPSDHV